MAQGEVSEFVWPSRSALNAERDPYRLAGSRDRAHVHSVRSGCLTRQIRSEPFESMASGQWDTRAWLPPVGGGAEILLSKLQVGPWDGSVTRLGGGRPFIGPGLVAALGARDVGAHGEGGGSRGDGVLAPDPCDLVAWDLRGGRALVGVGERATR